MFIFSIKSVFGILIENIVTRKKIEDQMKLNLFNTNHGHLLKKSLNVYTKQIRANSKNIANIDNPNYRRAKTNFSEELTSAQEKARLKVTNKKHILKPIYKNKIGDPGNLKKEKVNLNKEMGELAENQIRYNFSSNSLRRYYAGLKKSISGRL